jgi:hypothetical protein
MPKYPKYNPEEATGEISIRKKPEHSELLVSLKTKKIVVLTIANVCKRGGKLDISRPPADIGCIVERLGEPEANKIAITLVTQRSRDRYTGYVTIKKNTHQFDGFGELFKEAPAK